MVKLWVPAKKRCRKKLIEKQAEQIVVFKHNTYIKNPSCLNYLLVALLTILVKSDGDIPI